MIIIWGNFYPDMGIYQGLYQGSKSCHAKRFAPTIRDKKILQIMQKQGQTLWYRSISIRPEMRVCITMLNAELYTLSHCPGQGAPGWPWDGPSEIFTDFLNPSAFFMRIRHPQRIFKKLMPPQWNTLVHPSGTIGFWPAFSLISFLPDTGVHPTRYSVHPGTPRWKWWAPPGQRDRV